MIFKQVFGNAKNQALLTSSFLIVLTAVLVQFFFLGEQVEESRSRAAKLSIAEIIAQNQEQNEVQQVVLSNSDNQFAKAATENNIGALALISEDEKLALDELKNFSELLNLQGIIKNNRASIALIRIDGEADVQSLPTGANLGNGISIAEINIDSIFLSKNGALLEVRMANDESIESINNPYLPSDDVSQ